jgi:hypothetical protein
VEFEHALGHVIEANRCLGSGGRGMEVDGPWLLGYLVTWYTVLKVLLDSWFDYAIRFLGGLRISGQGRGGRRCF